MLLVLISLWSVSDSAAAEPGERGPAPETCDAEALDAAILRADEAVEALDPDGLGAATQALDDVLACQSRPIRVEQAAHVHRLHGILAFVQGNDADSWFAASRALEPTSALQPGAGNAGLGGPLESAWARAASATPPERTTLPPPRRGAIAIDGQLLDSHPTHLPYVFQYLDGDTAETTLAAAGTPAPRYPGYKPEPIEVPGQPTRRGKPLSVAFAAVAVGSAGLLGGAAWTRARYRNPAVDDDAAAALLPANQALGVAGYALGATAVGLGTVAVVVEW
jgi:hypothetical protein